MANSSQTLLFITTKDKKNGTVSISLGAGQALRDVWTPAIHFLEVFQISWDNPQWSSRIAIKVKKTCVLTYLSTRWQWYMVVTCTLGEETFKNEDFIRGLNISLNEDSWTINICWNSAVSALPVSSSKTNSLFCVTNAISRFRSNGYG